MILSEALHSIDLKSAKPAQSDLLAAPGMIGYMLSTEDESWLAYFIDAGESNSQVFIHAEDHTSFNVESIDTLTGETKELGNFTTNKGDTTYLYLRIFPAK